MAVYAIGDIQGCYDDLLRLLEYIRFNSESDQLWFAGDLVNRGPRSADVLRFAKALGSERVKVVLGNHDLHLLANSSGVISHRHHKDTMDSVLLADDKIELIEWLRHQPLFYHDESLAFSMVHAAVLPEWSISAAAAYAKEVEQVLQSDSWHSFFEHMYGNKPNKWDESLRGWDRIRFIANSFTRLRYCNARGELKLKFKGAPQDNPNDEIPWFEMSDRKARHDRIVFGHWSTLGTGQYDNVFSLDSGAVWGEALTAIRIDEQPYQWFSV